FDVGLHLGTFLAVLAYFWRDWWRIGRDFARGLARLTPFEGQARLGWLLLLGTIPGALAGILFEHDAETAFRDIRIVAVMLILLGQVLLVAERLAQHTRRLEQLSWADSLLVGMAQALAIIPGVSRSGSTISMSLFRGFQREAAARFSFLLGTPIILGASAKRLYPLFTGGLPPDETLLFVVGAVSAAVAGFATIALLLRYLQRHSTLPFVVYRLALGLGLLGLAAWRGL
ncbi:MAG: undecaprenyl-diphosphate phosphatase, partial [Dehalococcoidia bacterium]|nr:undecaprenyl-diphosphate phosphatase [Dehalococcoidia bacterium]